MRRAEAERKRRHHRQRFAARSPRDLAIAQHRFAEADRLFRHPLPIQAWTTDPIDSDDALLLWHEARRVGARSGFVPVLLGPEPMVDWTPRPAPAAALLPLVEDRLRARACARFSPQVVSRLRAEMDALRPAFLVKGGMPDNCDSPPSSPVFDDSEAVRCVLLGCRAHEIPLWLGLGGWNDSPEPDEQAAVLAAWGERHGTNILHIGRSHVAMWSDRPPRRIEEFRALVWESFLYCWDSAFQDRDANFGGLRRMLGGASWTFCWD